MEDVKKRALNLKIKATKSSNFKDGVKNFWESADDSKEQNDTQKELKTDIEQVKLEMVQELRDVKNTMTTSMT